MSDSVTDHPMRGALPFEGNLVFDLCVGPGLARVVPMDWQPAAKSIGQFLLIGVW